MQQFSSVISKLFSGSVINSRNDERERIILFSRRCSQKEKKEGGERDLPCSMIWPRHAIATPRATQRNAIPVA